MSLIPAQEAPANCEALLRSEMSECQCGKSDLVGQAPLFVGDGTQVCSGECNVPKVRQMVNGKTISNKPSVFFFSRPLASLRTFLPTSLYSDTGRKRILRSLVLNPQLSALWSRCGSR